MAGAILLVSASSHADIRRWDTNEVIQGTEGIEPDPGVQLDHRHLAYAHLGEKNLTAANFEASSLTSSDLENSTLTKANLTEANLYRATLTNAILAGANLIGASPQSTVFTRANLLHDKSLTNPKEVI